MVDIRGTVFGKYYLLERIAFGGMGEICLAKLKGPVGFEKLLVVKRILQHHLENQDYVDMFFAEARVAAQLHHANIVQIYEMGEIDDSYYIAMEYVAGKSLRDVVDAASDRGERVPAAYVIDIMSQMCTGMSYAHNAKDVSGDPFGIVHRDLNPQNLLVSYSGAAKIIDFGIAKSQLSYNKTETGTIKGKFVYMSPEQSAAEPLDKRSDIFSVGICLYEALTGVNPFAKANVVLSLDAIQRQDVPSLEEIDPALAPFDPIVGKALRKDPAHRYTDCSELADELQNLLASGVVPRSDQPLNAYMSELFASQISEEKQRIVDTDQTNSEELQNMLAYQEMEASGVGRRPTDPRFIDQQTGQYGPPRSQAPFVIFLLGILAVSGLGAVFALQIGRAEWQQELEIQKATDNATARIEEAAEKERERERQRELQRQAAAQANRPRNTTPTGGNTVDRFNDIKPRPKPKPKPSFGTLQISTVPPVRITRDGISVGQTVRLKSSVSMLAFGRGKDPVKDPFRVRIRCKLVDGAMTYAVTSSPWAVISSNGVGLGRSPIPPLEASDRTTLELANPDGRRLRISLRYSR